MPIAAAENEDLSWAMLPCCMRMASPRCEVISFWWVVAGGVGGGFCKANWVETYGGTGSTTYKVVKEETVV